MKTNKRILSGITPSAARSTSVTTLAPSNPNLTYKPTLKRTTLWLTYMP